MGKEQGTYYKEEGHWKTDRCMEGAQGWCTGMTQRDGMGLGWEWGSGWGTHVHPWLIHVNVWQNHYNIVK